MLPQVKMQMPCPKIPPGFKRTQPRIFNVRYSDTTLKMQSHSRRIKSQRSTEKLPIWQMKSKIKEEDAKVKTKSLFKNQKRNAKLL
jgi:hypothetical protein